VPRAAAADRAKRAADWGVALRPDDIVTTVGAMEALHLCLRAVARAGDTIAVESPAYYGILQLVEGLGMRALEIPANPARGSTSTSSSRR
jgi:DNA-binding transcriptional MocR family regulator